MLRVMRGAHSTVAGTREALGSVRSSSVISIPALFLERRRLPHTASTAAPRHPHVSAAIGVGDTCAVRPWAPCLGVSTSRKPHLWQEEEESFRGSRGSGGAERDSLLPDESHQRGGPGGQPGLGQPPGAGQLEPLSGPEPPHASSLVPVPV